MALPRSHVEVSRLCLLSFVHSVKNNGLLGAGYLMGPIIGSSIWILTHRRSMALIEARDREFHNHIVKNRVDPRAQSATNPVPDFYGMCYTCLYLIHF